MLAHIQLSSILAIEQYHSNHPSMIFTVLLTHTGIGHVLNLRFSPSFSTIMWDPPSIAGVLSGLTYHLTVTNMNTGVVIINTTTTDTSYSLGSIQYCTFYNASVTPMLQGCTGDSEVIIDRAPESKKTLNKNYSAMLCFWDYYRLIGASQMVVIINNAGTSVIFHIILQVINHLPIFLLNQLATIHTATWCISKMFQSKTDSSYILSIQQVWYHQTSSTSDRRRCRYHQHNLFYQMCSFCAWWLINC